MAERVDTKIRPVMKLSICGCLNGSMVLNNPPHFAIPSRVNDFPDMKLQRSVLEKREAILKS